MTSAVFDVQVIRDQFSISMNKIEVSSALGYALSITENEAMLLFNEIVGSWRHGVDFKRVTKTEGNDLVATITTDDEPFYYLNEGTPTPRHALMGKGFSPKTSVRTYRSGAGSQPYSPVFIHKNVNKPGISAREWTPMMAEDLQKDLERNVNIHISKISKV